MEDQSWCFVPIDDDWRAITAYELAVVRRLLDYEFPGRDALLQQLEDCKAKCVVGNGTLYFNVSNPVTEEPVHRFVVAEGVVRDCGGIPLHYYLVVNRGRLDFLDVVTEDLMPLRRIPEPSEIELVPPT